MHEEDVDNSSYTVEGGLDRGRGVGHLKNSRYYDTTNGDIEVLSCVLSSSFKHLTYHLNYHFFFLHMYALNYPTKDERGG